MEHTKHIWRAFLLLFALLIALIVIRHFAIPETFGQEGHYRFASLAEFTAQELVHGAPGACAECHEEQQTAHDEGAHASISCEVCHGPNSWHVQGTEKIADMPQDGTAKMCALCHRKLRARPELIKQIDFAQHLIDLSVLEEGQPVPPRACLVCHDPHSPKEEG